MPPAFAATIGGTTSVLAGGKFANGATTAAFQHLFNAEAGHDAAKDDDGLQVQAQTDRLKEFAGTGVNERLGEAFVGIGKGTGVQLNAGPLGVGATPFAGDPDVRIVVNLGLYKVVRDSSGGFRIVAARNLGPVTLSVDSNGRISGGQNVIKTSLTIGSPTVNIKISLDPSKGTIPVIPGTVQDGMKNK